MNKKVLLLSSYDIISNSVIEDNVDLKLLSKTIGIAQESGLKPILGNDLYNGLMNAIYDYSVSGISISTAYSNLIEASKNYLISKTVADFIIINSYKVSNKGLQSLNDNSATSISSKDIYSVRDYYKNLVSTYKAELVQFLKDSKLIDYKNDVQITSESTGWFLGTLSPTIEKVKEEVVTVDDYVEPESEYTYLQLNVLNHILLISASDVISNSVIEDNVDIKLLSKTIQQVQNIHLKPILGEALFFDTLNGVNDLKQNNTYLRPLYSDLLVLVKPYLINKVVAEFVIPNNYKFTGKGLLKLNDNSSTSLSDSELQTVKDYYDNLSTSYKIDLINFLEKYKLVNGTTDENITSDSTGWFLSTVTTGGNSVDVPKQSSYYDADTFITGGTFNNLVLNLFDNGGNIITVTGFTDNDKNITGGTYSNGTLSLTNNSGSTVNINGFYTGTTTTLSGGTGISIVGSYPNFSIVNSLPDRVIAITGSTNVCVTGTYPNFSISSIDTDKYITGGTYNNGVLSLINNSGNTININGFYTGTTTTLSGGTGINIIGSYPNFSIVNTVVDTDKYLTGGTYNNGVLSLVNNSGSTINVSGFFTGITSNNVTAALGYIPYNSTNPNGFISGITSSNVTTALGYTPYNLTNPNSYISGITSSNVTTALGFTPYNNTNPNGYISGITSGNVTTALGYTPYNSTNPNRYISGYTDTYTTGATFVSNTAVFTNNAGTSFSLSGFPDGFTTGFTYSNNTLSIGRNQGQLPLTATINVMTGLTINNSFILPSTGLTISTTILTGATTGIYSSLVINTADNGPTVNRQTRAIDVTLPQGQFIVNGSASGAIVANSTPVQEPSIVLNRTSSSGFSNLMFYYYGTLYGGLRSSGTGEFRMGSFASGAFTTLYGNNSEAARIAVTTNNILINTTTDAGYKLDVNGTARANKFQLSSLNTAPTSSTDTGVLGEIRYDSNYMYLCVATNTWKRSPLTTW